MSTLPSRDNLDIKNVLLFGALFYHIKMPRWEKKNLAEKDLGVLVDSLNKKQKCALVAEKDNSLLSCIKKRFASRSSFSSTEHWRDHTWSTVLDSILHEKYGMWEQAKRRAMKMMMRQQQLSSKQRLRELGLFSLGKRRFRVEFYQ